MKPYSQIDPAEYLQLDLRAHTLLADVPIHDVWRVTLPGGGTGRTVADIYALMETDRPNAAVRFLFKFRQLLGKVISWDHQPSSNEGMFAARLSAVDLQQTQTLPGSAAGPFKVLYQFDNEAASEIRNKTVHAALVYALQPTHSGYDLYWCIYTKPVGRITGLYMRLINPFRRFVVYPSLLSGIHSKWIHAYG